MKKFWNIHKIMLIILTSILLFACDGKTYQAYPLSYDEIKEMIPKCDSFGGVKSFYIKKIVEQKDVACVRYCEYNVRYFVDYVVCKNNIIIQKYDIFYKKGRK